MGFGFITCNMNPKLTDVTLNCNVFVIDVNIRETILELEEIHISAYTYTNLVFKIVTVDYSVVVVGALSLRT